MHLIIEDASQCVDQATAVMTYMAVTFKCTSVQTWEMGVRCLQLTPRRKSEALFKSQESNVYERGSGESDKSSHAWQYS